MSGKEQGVSKTVNEAAIKTTEIVKEGISPTELRFLHKCDTCDCEFKFCLEAVSVTRYGNAPTEYLVNCPFCHSSRAAQASLGKYTALLKLRERYIPESDY